MAENRLRYLLQRYFQHSLPAAEMEEMAFLTGQLNDEELEAELSNIWSAYNADRQLDNHATARILHQILTPQQVVEDTVVSIPHKTRFSYRWMQVAAAVVFVLLSASVLWWLGKGEIKQERQQPLAGLAKKYIQNITLPDGSTVVLQAGSNLYYPDIFTANSRDIQLEGEAYFEVEPDAARPFIIHTGKVVTTVLGTAFNIKAYPQQKQVIVSVTKGKVKVEDGGKLLAVLTPDQQLNYQQEQETVQQQQVDARSLVTGWTKQEMVFEATSLQDVITALQRRYGVHIELENEALKNCTIHSSFSGTEKLESVLNILCRIQHTTFSRKENGTIVISGKGCDVVE